MKKIIIPIGALLIAHSAHAQLTQGENYIQSKTYLDYSGTTPTKTSENVQYFDGLGKPKQVVNVKASPLGRDVVTHIEYDGFGRQVLDFLPVPQSGTMNGGIVPSSLANATQPDIYGSEKIFSEKVLDNSPLDRILEQKQVGNDWNTKPVKFGYDAVVVADRVRKFTTVTSWENGATKSRLEENWLYTDGQLYKNSVKDEDLNETIEFKNGQGQLILARKVIANDEYADTYYVYNEYNQLAFVIPPLASIRGDIVANTVKHDELCYQYRYDGRNRMVEKKIPGKGWEYMLYDRQDRLVASQDTVLKGKGQWLYTKYDQFGRVAITGIGTGGARSAEQTIVEEYYSNNVNRLTTALFERQGMDVYYGNQDNTYPNSTKWVTLLSLNYYDTLPGYSFNPSISSVLGEPILTGTVSNEKSTKGLPVLSLVKNIEDDNWTKNYSHYDTKGRAVGTYSINHLGGYTKTESKLDFGGVPQTVITKHKRLNTDTERVITENFTYDHQNRLLVHKHQVDNNPEEILVQNKYNELSQLENKKVGGVSIGSPLQSIDYKYNIRGWMTNINDPANLNGKLFGYSVKYNKPLTEDWSARYNGNISEIDWATQNDNTLRRYVYMYDPLNRLTGGYYIEPNSSILWVGTFNEYYKYDLNGNITKLTRTGEPPIGQTTSLMIDDLTYSYTGNRLQSVTDTSGNFNGYPIGGNIIGYDDNGNMISHKDKKINEISYNFQNLPSTVFMGQGKFQSTVDYLYSANGVKLRKTYRPNTGGTITDYLDGFQYESEVSGIGIELKFVPTSEGYYNFENNKYIYNYTDHLGNVRLSYSKKPDGSAEALEENDYYPFGLKQERSTGLYGNSSYNYKYNGKELQETGMYDYGARMYMPDIGRWGVVDPLAETSRRWSTYTYAYNNPMRFVDPDGMQNEDKIKIFNNGNIERTKDNNAYDTITNEDESKSIQIARTNVTEKNPTGDSQIGEAKTIPYNLRGEGTIGDKMTYLKIDNYDTATQFFEFAGENTNVEFAQNKINFSDGFSSNLINTNHLSNVVQQANLILPYLNLSQGNGLHIVKDGSWVENVHSHPTITGQMAPSGFAERFTNGSVTFSINPLHGYDGDRSTSEIKGLTRYMYSPMLNKKLGGGYVQYNNSTATFKGKTK
ncbi:DUF6443 domain-containing protein [Chryseobacterium sp.]|uniref:DUF6443 domain-containing protein n=1 Tax=Chryseobacterium sp. TaxID=1871047 RepID=UPI0025B923E2|nr:DUF6443 domain-containing protein [Chryseobacterium sp.]